MWQYHFATHGGLVKSYGVMELSQHHLVHDWFPDGIKHLTSSMLGHHKKILQYLGQLKKSHTNATDVTYENVFEDKTHIAMR